jgi:hypothetical protein
MRVQPLETLLAIKAINVASDLKARDKQVACVLIEHFNRKTGQCDPSFERIADLLQVSSRTIMRSIERLENARLFRVTRHGGHCNRNSYEPRWDRFQEIASAWDKRFKEAARSRTNLSPTQRQSCHLDGDKPVTQTFGKNLLKETCADGATAARSVAPPRRIDQKTPAGQGRGEFPRRSTPEGPRRTGTPRGEAARTAAERRWCNDLHDRYSGMRPLYEDILASLDPATAAEATEAELHERGAGLRHIVDWRRRQDSQSPKASIMEIVDEEAGQ